MKRALKILGLAVLALAGLAAAAILSGRQDPVDAVAEAERRHGIELESRLVDVNGVRLHVVLVGPVDGPPVLLLHGYPEFWWAWHEQIGRLAKAGFRVVAPDQRGYNASSKPTAVDAYRMEALTGDALALMDALGHRQFSLAGHDWGGSVAWRLAIAHPDRVRKLVMFNSPHPLAFAEAAKEGADEETVNWYRTFFQIPWLPEIVGAAGNWWLLTKNLRDSSRPGTFPDADLDYYRYAWDRDGSMRAMVDWYRAGYRYPAPVQGDGTVRVPTRIVWGMRDRFFDPRTANLSVNHCAEATLVELPDASHWLLHEEPERTSTEMIEFLR